LQNFQLSKHNIQPSLVFVISCVNPPFLHCAVTQMTSQAFLGPEKTQRS